MTAIKTLDCGRRYSPRRYSLRHQQLDDFWKHCLFYRGRQCRCLVWQHCPLLIPPNETKRDASLQFLLTALQRRRCPGYLFEKFGTPRGNRPREKTCLPPPPGDYVGGSHLTPSRMRHWPTQSPQARYRSLNVRGSMISAGDGENT